MTRAFAAQVERLVASLSRWLPAGVARERANNIACACLFEMEALKLGEMTPDEISSIERVLWSCLSRFEVTEDQIAHAAKAWKEDPCTESPSLPSS